jgi:hypothetical protein
MNSDDFENQLKRQPLRPAPAAWRAEILEAARAAAFRAPGPEQDDAGPFVPWWRAWLWPSPRAWAGLATVWLVILSIHALPASRPTEMAHSPSPSPPSPGTNKSLLAQRRELVRLLEGSADTDSVPKPAPGPRSEAGAPSKV